jgi:hypothetical protein
MKFTILIDATVQTIHNPSHAKWIAPGIGEIMLTKTATVPPQRICVKRRKTTLIERRSSIHPTRVKARKPAPTTARAGRSDVSKCHTSYAVTTNTEPVIPIPPPRGVGTVWELR